MDGFEAGPAELEQMAGALDQGNADLNGQLEQFLSAAQSATSAWSGNAATSFQGLAARFHEDSKKLNDALVAISEQVRGTKSAYIQQDEAANDNVSGIMNSLG